MATSTTILSLESTRDNLQSPKAATIAAQSLHHDLIGTAWSDLNDEEQQDWYEAWHNAVHKVIESFSLKGNG